jgi:N6-L-threonylcarbamoyladenine synthase
MINILAFETSCDETSISLVQNGTKEIYTSTISQITTHQNFGGVVPEIASRMHIEVVTVCLDDFFNKTKIKIEDISAIAVTNGPGLKGCLLIGLETAKTLAYVYNKPLIPVNHIAGHIYANAINKELNFPLIALVVSGGHTEIVYMKENLSFKKIGGTLDDSAGEAYDKVARTLGLSYPGGPIIDALSKEGNDTYNLPLPLDDNSYNFSFSGLKSAVINLKNKETINIKDMACSFQTKVVTILVKKTLKALKEYNVNNLILAGGVAANSGLREEFNKHNEINITYPKIKYCTDNATMIGACAYFLYEKGMYLTDDDRLTLNVNSNLELY